jgi:hypothetical protein
VRNSFRGRVQSTTAATLLGYAGAPEVWSKHRGGLLVPEAGDLTVSEEFPLKELTVLPGFTGTFNLTRTQQRVKDRARQVLHLQ